MALRHRLICRSLRRAIAVGAGRANRRRQSTCHAWQRAVSAPRRVGSRRSFPAVVQGRLAHRAVGEPPRTWQEAQPRRKTADAPHQARGRARTRPRPPPVTFRGISWRTTRLLLEFGWSVSCVSFVSADLPRLCPPRAIPPGLRSSRRWAGIGSTGWAGCRCFACNNSSVPIRLSAPNSNRGRHSLPAHRRGWHLGGLIGLYSSGGCSASPPQRVPGALKHSVDIAPFAPK